MNAACSLLSILFVALTATKCVEAQSQNATTLWELVWYTNYPRDYTTPLLSPDGSTVYYQGAYNCGYRLTLLSLASMTGQLNWNQTISSPNQCMDGVPPVMDNGNLFFTRVQQGDRPPSVVAYSAATGAEQWAVYLGSDLQTTMVSSQPAAALGMVVVYVKTSLYGINATTGQLKWTTDVGVDCTGHVIAPLAEGPVVICGSQPIEALDLMNGHRQWSYTIPQADVTNWWVGRPRFIPPSNKALLSVLPRGGAVAFVVQSADENGPAATVVSLDAETGSHLWTYTLEQSGYQIGDPHTWAYEDGVMVFTAYNATLANLNNPLYEGEILALDAANGTLKWATANTSTQSYFGGVAVKRGTVYVNNEVSVWSFDLRTGVLLPWYFETDWCNIHHQVGVECAMVRPLVSDDGIMYLSAAASIDHALIFAVQAL